MGGLFDFLNFMDQVKKTGTGINTAKVIGENDDVVRIMSIHKSKGLEFPLVIVGGMGKEMNKRPSISKVSFHKDIGIGMRLVDTDLGVYSSTLNQKLIRKQQDRELIAEEMRILYVAFTRAQDRLLLLGTVSDLDKAKEKWKIYDHYHIQDASCYLDWLVPVLKRQKECVDQLNDVLKYQIAEDDDCCDDGSRWIIEKKTKRDLDIMTKEQNRKKEEIKTSFKTGFAVSKAENTSIAHQLEWQYNFITASRIPSKLSVTEIRRLTIDNMKCDEIDIPKLAKKPSFIDKADSFSAMEKGTIMHLVMQHIDIYRTGSIEEINCQIEEMITSELLTNEEAGTIKTRKILSFFQSEIGLRMKKSDCVFREVPFNILKPARSVIKDVNDDEKLIVQGTIDCYFREGSQYILLDYKNDFISWEMGSGYIDRIVHKYSIQLNLYKEALQTIKGIKIDEVYLYLLEAEKAILIRDNK